MKIALVHDYLNEAGGAERVLRVLAEMYPKAPIYTAFIKNGTAREMFRNRVLRESAWGWLLKQGRMYSYLRLLLPWIWRSVDLSEYDLVITSTAGGYIARGFRVSKKTRVVAYCHTPPKWLYGYETPTGAGKKWWGRLFIWVVGPYLRYFDYMSAQRVDKWLANSREVASRIAKFYRREATVVYPPIEVSRRKITDFQIRRDYYLLVTRITGGKGVAEAVAGVQRAGVKLRIAGERVSTQFTVHRTQFVEYLGRVSDEQLTELYAGAKGFIALARDEDFGMSVVEAMQYGVPVLALRSGGYRETVLEGSPVKTGVFVEDTDAERVARGIAEIEQTKWDYKAIAKWGQSFNRARFENEVREAINARTT